MKAYQSPEILWQDVDLADILTGSPNSTITVFGGANGSDSGAGKELGWWI